MKQLVGFYLAHQDCTKIRKWENWPFHKIYNYYTNLNGGKTCVEKWREIIEANWETIICESDFNTLYSRLKQYAASVPGIGALHVYDTATCFLHPTEVFLHHGTKIASDAIRKIKSNVSSTSVFSEYNSELARLTPLQMEDFLCINKEVFKGDITSDAQLVKHMKKLKIASACGGQKSKSSSNPLHCGCKR